MTFGTTELYKYVWLADDRKDKTWTYLENYLNQKVFFAPVFNANDPFEGAFKHHVTKKSLSDPISQELLYAKCLNIGEINSRNEFKRYIESPNFFCGILS